MALRSRTMQRETKAGSAATWRLGDFVYGGWNGSRTGKVQRGHLEWS